MGGAAKCFRAHLSPCELLAIRYKWEKRLVLPSEGADKAGLGEPRFSETYTIRRMMKKPQIALCRESKRNFEMAKRNRSTKPAKPKKKSKGVMPLLLSLEAV